MITDQQLEILRKAAVGTLPTEVDSASLVPVHIVQDLIVAGYLAATDLSNFDGPSFFEPRITTCGREYLRVLEERVIAASPAAKVRKYVPAAVKWTFGIVAGLILAYLIHRFIG